MSECRIEVEHHTPPRRLDGTARRVYLRHQPESTALYEVVRDNLETLFGAIDDGALAVRIPRHARKELLGYLDCGLLCRGFARLKCRACDETRLVAFSCKGRGFCPSCMGRRMCGTAANLIERVLPPRTPLRQWVLTFPFPWRPRLAQDGELLGRLTQIFVDAVQAFYARRAAREGARGAKTGAVTVVQRASSDMRLNPHLHTIALDGAWYEQGDALVFSGLGHLRTSEVGDVLERAVLRIERHLDRCGPGGQNVNKVASKVELRLDVSRVEGLDEAARARLSRLAGARFDAEGRLLVTSQSSRDQGRNLEDAKAKALELIERSTVVPKSRRPTRPSKASKARRLDTKKKDARRKAVRRDRRFDD